MTKRLVIALLGVALWVPEVGAQDAKTLEFFLTTVDGTSAVGSTPPEQRLAFQGPVEEAFAPATARQVPGPHDLVVVARDGEGRGLARQAVTDPSYARVEQAGEDGALRGEDVWAAQASLYVSVPVETARVAVYRPSFSASGFEVGLVDEVDVQVLPQARSAEQTCSRETFEFETVVPNGKPSERLDILFVGEGFTAAEQGKFRAAVDEFAGFYRSKAPFDEYGDLINIHMVETISEMSLASEVPQDPSEANTVFGGYVNGAGRFMFDQGCAQAVASRHFRDWDVIFVVVNRSIVAYKVGDVVALNVESVTHTALHELGHVLGLADEYRGCVPHPDVAGWAPNITVATTREQVEWRHWIDPRTPVPTTFQDLVDLQDAGVVAPEERDVWPGLHALNKKECLGVPTFNPGRRTAMHRVVNSFGPINSEAIVRRLFTYTSTLKSAAPNEEASTVIFRAGNRETQTFEVETLREGDEVMWYLDGRPLSSGRSVTLASWNLGAGESFELEAAARHVTDHVRVDPLQRLTSRRRWSVFVDDCAAAPEAPPNLRVHATTNRTLKAAWDETPGAAFYRMQLTGSHGGTRELSTADLQALFEDLEPDVDYELSVRAVNQCGESPASTSAISTRSCTESLDPPTNLQVVSVGETHVSMRWDPGPGADVYALSARRPGALRLLKGRSELTVDDVFTMRGLPPGTELSVRVAAQNDCLNREAFVEVPVTTRPACSLPPATPEQLQASEVTEDAFELAWREAPEAESYSVYRYQDGQYMGGAETLQTGRSFAELEPGTSQEVLVYAENACGLSSPARLDVVLAGDACGPPSRPAEIRATAVAPREVTLSWDPVPGATSYVLQTFRFGSGGSLETLEPIAGTRYTVSGLEPNTLLYANVRAVNACGQSEDFAYTFVELPDECTQPPAAPGSMAVEETRADGFSVAWEPVAGASHYVVETWTADGITTHEPVDDPRFTATDVAPLTGGYVYVRVRAANACGESEGATSLFVSL